MLAVEVLHASNNTVRFIQKLSTTERRQRNLVQPILEFKRLQTSGRFGKDEEVKFSQVLGPKHSKNVNSSEYVQAGVTYHEFHLTMSAEVCLALPNVRQQLSYQGIGKVRCVNLLLAGAEDS
jgi:hypothetical protein